MPGYTHVSSNKAVQATPKGLHSFIRAAGLADSPAAVPGHIQFPNLGAHKSLIYEFYGTSACSKGILSNPWCTRNCRTEHTSMIAVHQGFASKMCTLKSSENVCKKNLETLVD